MIDEFRCRRVFRVGVVYAVVAFVIWQAAEIAFPALSLPDWSLTLVIVLTLLGFPNQSSFYLGILAGTYARGEKMARPWRSLTS